MNKQDIRGLLNEIVEFMQSMNWECEYIEDKDIPSVRIAFDMDDDANQLSEIAPSLKQEEYFITYLDVPEESVAYSGMLEILSRIELPLGVINPAELMLLVNQVNQIAPLGTFFIQYDFQNKENRMEDAVLGQKYTFFFSTDGMFSLETLSELLLLLLEQKRIIESMIAAINMGQPATEIIAAFVRYGK